MPAQFAYVSRLLRLRPSANTSPPSSSLFLLWDDISEWAAALSTKVRAPAGLAALEALPARLREYEVRSGGLEWMDRLRAYMIVSYAHNVNVSNGFTAPPPHGPRAPGVPRPPHPLPPGPPPAAAARTASAGTAAQAATQVHAVPATTSHRLLGGRCGRGGAGRWCGGRGAGAGVGVGVGAGREAAWAAAAGGGLGATDAGAAAQEGEGGVMG